MSKKEKKKLQPHKRVVNILSSLDVYIEEVKERTDAEIIELESDTTLDEVELYMKKAACNLKSQGLIDNRKHLATHEIYFDCKYNLTTEDISILLDLEPLYVTRHIRDYYVRSCVIPLVSSLKFILPTMEYIKISKKKFLYSRDDLKSFIKKHLYRADRYVYLDVKEMIQETNIELHIIELLSQKYIDKIVKKYKADELIRIDDKELNDIMQSKVQLLRLDSIKEVVKYNMLYNRYQRALKDFEDGHDKEEFKKEIKDEMETFKNRGGVFDPAALKKANMINQKQLERFMQKKKHTKYNLILENNKSIPIVLYSIEDEDINEENVGRVALPESLLNKLGEEEIKKGIIEYIQKNKNKGNEELEDF